MITFDDYVSLVKQIILEEKDPKEKAVLTKSIILILNHPGNKNKSSHFDNWLKEQQYNLAKQL